MFLVKSMGIQTYKEEGIMEFGTSRNLLKAEEVRLILPYLHMFQVEVAPVGLEPLFGKIM